ncbi:MAG: PPOX class F420-dependent oxidoreductase [Chloroflexota bacterium]|nr:PPOX class F420-dependent oxidoreductase [Chloroflexota bacterium]
MRVLSPAMRAFLEEKRFAVLATLNADGSSQQTVMWYLIEDDELLFNTKRGRKKQRNLERDPRVSLCIGDGYRFVTVSGTARELSDPATAQADIRRLAARYSGEPSAEQQMQRFSREERISYRVRIGRILSMGF